MKSKSLTAENAALRAALLDLYKKAGEVRVSLQSVRDVRAVTKFLGAQERAARLLNIQTVINIAPKA